MTTKWIWIHICLLFSIGCGSSAEIVSPEVSARAAELSALLTSSKTVETKSDEILKAVESNTTALSEIKSKVESLEGSLLETRQTVGTLEASLIVPKSASGKEVIKSALEPAPVVNASSGAGPGRLTSDGTRLRWNVSGNWNPTILETSAHLAREHGINTDGMSHQQMADLHADLHDGKPVAMKSKVVQAPFAEWTWHGASTYCPNDQCPTQRSVSRRRR